MQHSHLSRPCPSTRQQALRFPAGASTAPSLQMGPSGGGTSHLMRSSLSWQRRGRSSSAVPTILTVMSWPAALTRAESGSLALLRQPCCKSTSSTGRVCCRSYTCLLASCSSAWVSCHHCFPVRQRSPITTFLLVHSHQSLPCLGVH